MTSTKTTSSNKITCNNINQLNEALKNNSNIKGRIFLLFSGSIDSKTGKSWCPDCVQSQPFIDKAIKEGLNDSDLFIKVFVGQRKEWKDKTNVFRTDSRFKINSVPTLLLYNTQKRLVESQCNNSQLLQMIFEE